MISESTRPATPQDLEKLDKRRHAVLWADGTPWGCLLMWPFGVTAVVAVGAVLVAVAKQDWQHVRLAIGLAAAVSWFIVAWIVGGEWLKLYVLASRRPARAAAHPPITQLAATGARAWMIFDESTELGTAPFVVFDAGNGEYLAVHASLALGLKRHTETEIPGTVTLDLEPGSGWPFAVDLAGTMVPLIDLLVDSPATLRPSGAAKAPPARLRLGQLSEEFRERVLHDG